MPSIDKILDEVGFVDWKEEEQKALSGMMHNFASKGENRHVIGKTDRVLTTFIKILERHIPPQKNIEEETV
ncbi:hypothetical protein DRQ25_14605 [Candidatus Fermentibacteria bacterium]|nr:MAG: hypothetical protein DRQ25_14605 [Candidatus Fermentibacteria bacterium]